MKDQSHFFIAFSLFSIKQFHDTTYSLHSLYTFMEEYLKIQQKLTLANEKIIQLQQTIIDMLQRQEQYTRDGSHLLFKELMDTMAKNDVKKANFEKVKPDENVQKENKN